jgi:hypothetical protein
LEDGLGVVIARCLLNTSTVLYAPLRKRTSVLRLLLCGGRAASLRGLAVLPSRPGRGPIRSALCQRGPPRLPLPDYTAEMNVDLAIVSELIKVGKKFLESARDYVGPQES